MKRELALVLFGATLSLALAVLALGMTAPVGAQETAPPLQSGETVEGAIEDFEQRDEYGFETEVGDAVGLQLSRTGGTGDLLVVVVDPNDEIATWDVVGPGETADLSGVAYETGTYRVLVTADTEDGAGPYALTYVDESRTPDEDPTEASNEEIRPLRPGESAADEIGGAGEVDLYGVDAAAGESIGVEIAREGGSGSLLVGVYDPEGDVIEVVVVGADAARTVSAVAERDGTHYVAVLGVDDDAVGSYSLTLLDAETPGDAIEEPVDDAPAEGPPSLQPGESVDGELEGPEDAAVYGVDATAGDPIGVEFAREGGSGYVYVAIVDPAGEIVGVGVVGPGEAVRASSVAETDGIHHVAVFGATDDAAGPYSLTLLDGAPDDLLGGAPDDVADGTEDPPDDATRLDSCTTITEPGEYVLTDDIEDSGENTCIEIRSDDVVFDGGGHAIDGDLTDEDVAAWREARYQGIPFAPDADEAGAFPFEERWQRVGVYVNTAEGDADPVSNVTVRNVTVSDWYFGTQVVDVDESAVRDVTATGNGDGVAVLFSGDVSVADSNASANGFGGVMAYRLTNSEVTRTEASHNGWVGFDVSDSSNNVLSENVANSNGFVGVWLSVSTDNALVANTALSNPLDNIVVVDSENTTLEDNNDGSLLFEPTDGELGVEGGHAAADELEIDQTDGLTREETVAYVYRTIARAEELRELEFEEPFRLRIITREEFEEREALLEAMTPRPEPTVTDDRLWEVLFMQGQQTSPGLGTDTGTAGASERGTAAGADRLPGREAPDRVHAGESDARETTAGYFLPATNDIVMITDAEGLVVMNESVLIHEITHALAHQHFGLDQDHLYGETFDEDRAIFGLIEGDATYVERRYHARCADDWQCVADPAERRVPPAQERDEQFHAGHYITGGFPYVGGPGYVAHLVEEGGWEVVDERYDDPPASTSQILHPDVDAEASPEMEYEDRSTDDWEAYHTNRVGEMGVYSMFWYQEWAHGVDVLETDVHGVPVLRVYFPYYDPVSEGWANDHLVQYHDQRQHGYVWTTEWDSEADAAEFHEAYVTMLEHHGAERQADDTWVVPEGEFADAYRVVLDGTTVEIVNAPTTDDIDDVRSREAGTEADAPEQPA